VCLIVLLLSLCGTCPEGVPTIQRVPRMNSSDNPRGPRGIRVLIVADVRLYREGLAASLVSRDHLVVMGTCGSRADALAQIERLSVDVVIVDMATKESLDLIADMGRAAAGAKILAFAVEEVASEILDCAQAGAAGYVTVDATIDELVAAIESIARGELVCPPHIAATLFCHVSRRADRRAQDVQRRTLTGRERQVLQFIQEGYSNKEIAQRLCISEPTVKNHVHNLLEKLQVNSRSQAAARTAASLSRRR
jgi:two-component system nitrate/nitrite response regulator NarL